MAKKRRTELDLDLSSEPLIAEETEEAVAPPTQEEEAPPLEKPSIWPKIPIKLVVLVGALLFILTALGITAYLVLTKPAEVEKIEEEVKNPTPTPIPYEPLITYDLAPFFLPMDSSEGGKEFLSIQFALEINNEAVRKELDRNLLLIRESILLYIQTKREEDFQNPEKRMDTLSEIKTVINRSLQSGHVKQLFVIEMFTR